MSIFFSAGAGGVVLTYKTPDGGTGQNGASKNRDPNAFDLIPESDPNSVIAPGDILSFLNNVRSGGIKGGTANMQENEINNNVKGRKAPAKLEPTTRASIIFANPETEPNSRQHGVNDELEQFITTTQPPISTTETPRRDDLAEGTE